jgi:indolepyruvate ferredoxin oxidoreductase
MMADGSAPSRSRENILSAKYDLAAPRAWMSGLQALVRLPLMQSARDRTAGLNTGGFITGYRGSPLGGYDTALGGATRQLEAATIIVHPAVNEELAADTLWGTQQTGLFRGARVDGVFGLWYGKGPGVYRAGDALMHANLAGTSPRGGVLALAGDDPVNNSSTLPHQSEPGLIAAGLPILVPGTVQDVLDYGLHGLAMSRFSGAWVSLKLTADVVESSTLVDGSIDRVATRLPTDYRAPPGGLHIRWPDPPVAQEERLLVHKHEAARAYVRANALDHVTVPSPRPRFGIVAVGKAHADALEALALLGLSHAQAAALGIAVFKVACVWPLEPQATTRFAQGLEALFVIEEKRPILEGQVKELAYHWPADRRPRIHGKKSADGEPLLREHLDLSPALIALALLRVLPADAVSPAMREAGARIAEGEARRTAPPPQAKRPPYFCSGCPHNTSTKIPEGSQALAGIGCHYLVQGMERRTETFTQMGGEGASWIGLSPFTDLGHVFINIGDGTYYHSGILAIRAAIAGNVNATYKILYNDAVAMTGGQGMDGPLTVPAVAAQMLAEGAVRVVVVSDEPEKYAPGALPTYVALHHRDELEAVQRELRELPGVTVLIYDQLCATEKRRRRKRHRLPQAKERVFINPRVCEGCGDCSVQSNCLSVVPLETPLGRKRQIDQSSCNVDLSCIKGFCPSFVTVRGVQPMVKSRIFQTPPPAPAPARPMLGPTPFNIVIAGIGGTGVVTLSAILGVAATLDGVACITMDQTGLAQKGGSVVSMQRFARDADALQAARVPTAEADLLLACDWIVSAQPEILGKARPGRTFALVNAHKTVNGEFTRDRDYDVPVDTLAETIAAAVGGPHAMQTLDAVAAAETLVGDTIGANMLLLGAAFQRGLVPLSEAALIEAIRLNGAAIDLNLACFAWGRAAVAQPEAFAATVAPRAIARSLDEDVAWRFDDLVAYQNRAYAERYRALVETVRAAEARTVPGSDALTSSVARHAYKLMAYKDEYEIARLMTEPAFDEALTAQFGEATTLSYHLAPPVLSRHDPLTGRPVKRTYGPWMGRAFSLLRRAKFLRGTPFDPFGRTAERRGERALWQDYEADMRALAARLSPANHAAAVALAELPDRIRGFGPLKSRSLEAVAPMRVKLRAALGLS